MKKIFYISILLFFSFNIFGQSTTTLPRPLGNSGIPVSFKTGAVNLNIPLYTATSGNLSLPISLVYSSNGIKNNETPSEVGLGWKLNTGGKITQISKGAYYLSPTDYNESDLLNNNIYEYNHMHKGWSDSEADIYILQLPGYNNQFYFSYNNGKIKTINNSNIKIQIEYSKMKCFNLKVILENGTVYYFNVGRPYIYFYNCIGGAHETWEFLLTKIVSANKTDSIIIKYEKYEPDIKRYDTLMTYGDRFAGKIKFPNHWETNYIENIINPIFADIYIDKIITNNEIIDFSIKRINSLIDQYETPYEDASCYNPDSLSKIDKVLKNIKISDKQNNLIRQYDFLYIISLTNRIFLQTISEKTASGKTKHPYIFTYNNYKYLPEIFSTGNIWNNPSSYETIGLLNDFFNENINKREKGLLSKITYPSRAYKKIYYEPNFYKFDTTPNSPWYDENWDSILTIYENTYYTTLNKNKLKGPGLRVKKIVDYNTENDSIVTEFEYTKNNNISSGRLTAYPRFKFEYIYNLFTNTYRSTNHFGIQSMYINYSKISLYKGGKIKNQDKGVNGKIVYNYSVEPPYNTCDEHTDDDWPYSLKKIDKPFNGLLLKKSVYDNSNNLKSQVINNYQKFKTDSVLNLRLIGKDDPEDSNPANFHGEFFKGYYYTYQYQVLLDQKITKTFDDNQNPLIDTTNYTYNSYNKVSEIQKTNSWGDNIITKLHYPFDFNGYVYDKMIERNILSTVIKKEIFKNNEKISGSFTLFDTIITKSNDTLLLPMEDKIWEENNWVTKLWYDKYDDNANLLQSHGIDQVYKSIIKGYNNTKTTATVTNAKVSEIFHDDFETNTPNQDTNSYTGKFSKHIYGDSSNAFAGVHRFTLNDLKSENYIYSAWLNTYSDKARLVIMDKSKNWLSFEIPNTNGKWKYFEIEFNKNQLNANSGNDIIECHVWANNSTQTLVDNVRFFPADAYMNTKTYDPLIGVLSETGPNNNSVFYEYDSFGRQIKLLNTDKKVVKKVEYNDIEYTFPDFDFTIDGPNSAAEGDTILLVIDDGGIPRKNNIIYNWYDDYEFIGTGNYIEIEINSSFTIHIKVIAKYNGLYSNIKHHDITIKNF